MVFKQIKKLSVEFRQHLLSFFCLFLSMDLINQICLIPFFRHLTTYLLWQGEVPLDSEQNLQMLAGRHPLIILGLLLDLNAFLLVLYLETAFVLNSVNAWQQAGFSFKKVWQNSWQALKSVRIRLLLLLLVYFLLLVSGANLIFRTPLLVKIKLIQFIVAHMIRNQLLFWLGIFCWGVFVLIGLRYLFVLPLIMVQKVKFKLAWQKNRQLLKQTTVVPGLMTILLLALIMAVLINSLLFLWQKLLQLLPGKCALFGAIINLTFLQLMAELLLSWTVVTTLLLLFSKLELPRLNLNEKSKNYGDQIIKFVVLILTALVIIPTNIHYFTSNYHLPVLISHRGVNGQNSVQNTLQALKRTHKLKPDYVEIDLHETKDQQFIVMHDANLAKLTRVNKTPKELTLRELTRLTARENGHRAKLVSFRRYLQVAEKLKQKLLIELKTTPQDSSSYLRNFDQRYGALIKKRHDQVQSGDYRVVRQLRRLDPHLTVIYIQPYNLTYPLKLPAGYAMEYSSLNLGFIRQAHLHHQLVYAWTVNQRPAMRRLLNEQVDGIITDNVAQLKQVLTQYRQPDYAQRLLNYALPFPLLD